jgi:hypothetical protein
VIIGAFVACDLSVLAESAALVLAGIRVAEVRNA